MKKVFYQESFSGGGVTIIPSVPPKPKGSEQPFLEEEKLDEYSETNAAEDEKKEINTEL